VHYLEWINLCTMNAEWIFIVYNLISNFVSDVTHSNLQDGYQIKLNKLESCDSKGTLKLTNPKATFTKDCHILVSGCADLTASFSSCKVSWNMGNAHCATAPYLNRSHQLHIVVV